MENEKPSEKIPLFKSWTGWYILVIVFLLILAIFFYYFTKTFS